VRARRLAILAILALAVVPALFAFHSRSFFSPDETNYTQVAREMLETGDLVVPHLDGQVWFNKPPLAYWLLAAAFALLGWGFPAAVLLNTLLTALTAIVLLHHAGGRERPRAGVLAAVAYLTMALPLTTARTALTDPTLVLCTTGAIVFFLASWRGAGIAAGVMLGLGILAKGPVAPLVVLPAMAVAAWQAGRRSGLRRFVLAAGVAALLVLPWQLALVARGLWAAWASEFLAYETLARATETWRISAPWWYYLPVLWVAVFPWGTHLAVAVAACIRGSALPWRARPQLPEVAAVLVPVVAFSLATNKLPHYVLPVLPFLAVWLGRAGDRLWEQDRVPAPRWATLIVAVTGGGALTAAAWLAGHSRATRFLPPVVALVLAAAAVAFVALALIEGSGRRRAAWAGMAALALALRLGLDAGLAPHLDRQLPERPLAEAVRSRLEPGGQPIAHGWWRTGFVAYGARGWVLTETQPQLAAALWAAREAQRQTVVVVRADREGEARAAAWQDGGEAIELARVVGLGEIDGEIIEGIVFRSSPRRSGERWFYDAAAPLAGESGFSGVEATRWISSFRWTTALAAVLPVGAVPPGNATLRLRCWGARSGSEPQRLEVRLGARIVGEARLETQPRVYAWSIAAGALAGGPTTLTLTAGHLAVPDEPGSSDTRTLGVAVDWIVLDPASPTTTLVE
jgi:4-amino-4-deoxy-L-arabinose transferase-like glycosyltransferase